jgi:hypothetical protein
VPRAISFASFLALLGAAAPALAQYEDALLEAAPAPQLSPLGSPSGGLAASPLSYAVWNDEAGWHVRMNAGSSPTRFNGTIGAPFGVTHPRTMSPSLPLDVTSNGISFDFQLNSGQTGFDFQAPQGSCLDFRLSIDGRDRATRIAVGRTQTQPGPGGFQLCGPGQMDAQAVQGPKMDPAAFTEQLAPFGTWSEVEGYGSVWQPSAQIVGPGFIPYTDGKWVYTNAGWVFVSSYDWGWAPFHYGNWVLLDSGWYWRPGSVWGPAWVEWRYGKGYFGWAPLPPLDAQVVAVEPAPFVFIPVDRFTAPNVRPLLISGTQAEAITPQTSALVSAAVVEGQPVVPVNAGPAPETVVVSGVPVQAVQVTTLVTVVPPPTVVVTAGFVIRPMPYYRPYPYPYYGRPPPYYGRYPGYGAPGYRPPAYYPPPGRPIPGTPTAPPPGGRPPGGSGGQPPRVTPAPGGGSGGASPSTRPGGGGASPSTRPGGGGASPSTRPGGGGASPSTRPSGGGASPSTRPSGGGASPSTRPSGGGASPAGGSRGGSKGGARGGGGGKR